MKLRSIFDITAIAALAFPLLAFAQSAGVSNTTNLGGGVSTTTSCSVGTTASGGGSTSNNTLSGGGSVGSGATCTNSTGYSDPNGYIGVDTSCSSGSFANAQGVAGAGGLMMCADASTGSSCSVAISGSGTSSYGGGGGSAGVSGGSAQGAGFCGGMTFTGGAVNIQYCGTLAYDVGVDFCVNGSVNYANIINRAEPFASRAVAQAAKCAASNTAASGCVFTAGDLMANAAGPYYRRARDFYDANGKFVAGPAVAVWNNASSVAYRTGNYAKSAVKYAGTGLSNTTYTATGQVVNAANQVVDVASVSKAAAERAGATASRGVVYAANTTGNTVAVVATNTYDTVASTATNTANTVGSTVTNTANSVGSSVKKAFKKW